MAGERWDVGRGTPTKLVFDTQREMTMLHQEVISFGFTAPLFNFKQPHDWLTQSKRMAITKLRTHTVAYCMCLVLV